MEIKEHLTIKGLINLGRLWKVTTKWDDLHSQRWQSLRSALQEWIGGGRWWNLNVCRKEIAMEPDDAAISMIKYKNTKEVSQRFNTVHRWTTDSRTHKLSEREQPRAAHTAGIFVNALSQHKPKGCLDKNRYCHTQEKPGNECLSCGGKGGSLCLSENGEIQTRAPLETKGTCRPCTNLTVSFTSVLCKLEWTALHRVVEGSRK